MLSQYPIELLAPAKDLECGYAAINSGADAVYIGAPVFGARENAANPIRDIARLTEYAHIYWAKVYVAINTLLCNHEVPQAVNLANQLYNAGVDALIIQDYALLECDLPPIPLIASTQMHNNTPERVRFLENAGFQRAILARELSLEEIKSIRNYTQIELEVFVHGSLCVSYSGQCYMSYAIGGRSGNRGQCAQPCRRAYSLADADGNVLVSDKHLLSLKDLNRLKNLDDLLDAGVTSFKIEGRLKDKVYVSNVVSQYRQRLDALIDQRNLKQSSSGTVSYAFTPDVNKTFNRGYTPYYLQGRNIEAGSIDTPKMVGEALGTVKDVRNRTVTISGNSTIVPGDGVCWFDSNKKLQGTSVNKVIGHTVTLNENKGISKGILLYRNHDHTFITTVTKNLPVRAIQIALILEESASGFKLTATDADQNQASAYLNIERDWAVKVDQAEKTIHKQLARGGGTPYKCDRISIQCSKIPFIPVAKLNELRRKTLDALTDERDIMRPLLDQNYTRSETLPYPEVQLTYLHNVLNTFAETFYRKHGAQTIEPAAESGMDMRGKTVMRTRQCIRRQLGWCTNQKQIKHNGKPLILIGEDGHRYPLVFDCAQCEMEVRY